MKFIPIEEKSLINLKNKKGKLKNDYAEKRPNSLVKGSKEHKRLLKRLLKEGKTFQALRIKEMGKKYNKINK